MIALPLWVAVPAGLLAALGLVQIVVVVRTLPQLVRQEVRRRENAAKWAAERDRWEAKQSA